MASRVFVPSVRDTSTGPRISRVSLEPKGRQDVRWGDGRRWTSVSSHRWSSPTPPFTSTVPNLWCKGWEPWVREFSVDLVERPEDEGVDGLLLPSSGGETLRSYPWLSRLHEFWTVCLRELPGTDKVDITNE